jgi:UDP-N-acetylglucosamine 3-dehydrogenase
MINIAILGSGFMGQTHAAGFSQIDDVNIVGVSSRSREKAEALAKDTGCESFTDDMELLRDPRIEAVSITVPTHLHRDYTVAALEAGKHVLVEKPMALTVSECDDMIAAAEKSGKVLMVAQVLRFWPEYMRMKEILDSGELGEPLAATALRLSNFPRWGEWFSDPALTGGAVHDLQIHDVDTLNWFFGQPQMVHSLGHKQEGGWYHTLTLLDYGKVAGNVESSFIMPDGYPFTMGLRVLCTGASIEFYFRAGGTGIESGDESGSNLMIYEPDKEPRPVDVVEGDGYANQAAYFAECIREGKMPERGTKEQGRLAVEVVRASRRSLDENEPITL